MKKELIFLWNWCDLCGTHIICPRCGNNTCNGGFGILSSYLGGNDNGECPICNLAYQYAKICFDNNLYPKDKYQIKEFNEKIIKEHTR